MESVSGYRPTTLLVGASLEFLGLARVLGRRGEQVALMARSEVRLQQLRTQMEGEGIPCRIFPVDVTEPDAVLGAFREVSQWSRRLDRLIYSKGAVSSEQAIQLTEPELHRVMSVNLFGFVNCFQFARPMLKRSGGGTVVIIVAGPPQPEAESGVAQQVSRAALQIYAAALRREVSRENIFVCELTLGRVREGENVRDLEPEEIAAGLLHVVDHRPDRYVVGSTSHRVE
jgi:short-subunit dehydrogenase